MCIAAKSIFEAVREKHLRKFCSIINFWKWEVGRGKFYDEISTSIIFDLHIILIKLSHCKLSTVNLQLLKHTPNPSREGSLGSKLRAAVCFLATNARIIKIPILKFQIPTSILVPPKTTLTIGFGRRPEASRQKGDPDVSGPIRNLNCLTRYSEGVFEF